MKSRKFAKVAVMTVCAVLACCAVLLSGCSQGSQGAASSAASAESAAASAAAASDASTSSMAGIHHAKLVVEGYDPITIELNADAAPITVANFCDLAQQGYYNGLTFYRFVDGFCMQGGTKGNSASGGDGSLKPITGEFSQNGCENELADHFVKGTVAMARTSDPDSATSTFFVTLDSSEQVGMSLNGQYAAFGTIDDQGMAIVDQIVADYLPKVTDPGMGAIANEADQAKITSVEIVD